MLAVLTGDHSNMTIANITSEEDEEENSNLFQWLIIELTTLRVWIIGFCTIIGIYSLN